MLERKVRGPVQEYKEARRRVLQAFLCVLPERHSPGLHDAYMYMVLDLRSAACVTPSVPVTGLLASNTQVLRNAGTAGN